MKLSHFAWPAAWLATCGLVAPLPPAAAQVPATTQEAPAAAIVDVALTDAKVLHGFVVDGQGFPMPDTEVAVMQSGRLLARATTTIVGQFRFEGLRGGMYQLTAGSGSSTLRVWEAQAAPPAAKPAVMLVGNQDVVRGQVPFRRAFASDAFVLTAIVVAAVAIPVAVANSRNAHPSSS